MWHWLSNQSPGRVARWASIFVLGLWLIWMAAAAAGTTRKWPPDISALGQSGDTFGSINALFTGLALIGLVYTVFLQRVEIEDNRQSLQASRREQFLSARLNARTALLQAAAAIDAHTRSVAETSPTRVMFIPSPTGVKSERLALEILLCEIHSGVTPDPWTPLVERAALRDYCLNRMAEIVMAMKESDESEINHQRLIFEFVSDYKILARRYSVAHVGLIKKMSPLFERVRSIEKECDSRLTEISARYQPTYNRRDISADERQAAIKQHTLESQPVENKRDADILDALESLKGELAAMEF